MQAERKAQDMEARAEAAKGEDKAALQVEVVKQRQAADTIKSKLQAKKVEKESYRVSFEEKPSESALKGDTKKHEPPVPKSESEKRE